MPYTNTRSKKQVHSITGSKCQSHRSGDPNTAFHDLTPAEILHRFGMPKTLLSTSSKAAKCRKVGVLARVMYLTPGVFCPNATTGCLASCLGHSSGRMGWPTHAGARDKRAALYFEDREAFVSLLTYELRGLEADARREGLIPAARLNGSSDIAWETQHADIFRTFPGIRFFDYTKSPRRMNAFMKGDRWPENYHLTFSVAADNHLNCQKILAAGGTVTAVFHPELPDTWNGYSVVDGDEHDARFFDEKGVVVGLRAKGAAKDDRTGFTILAA